MAATVPSIAKLPERQPPGGNDQLLRNLVAQLAGARAEPCGSQEEIVLDVELEDARYLLVRMPRADRSGVQLSPRELEIVRMVAKGHSNKMIADVLSISAWTVCTHLRRIFAKLGVCSRAAMVAQLMRTTGKDTGSSEPMRPGHPAAG